MQQNEFDPKQKVDLEVIIGTKNEGHDVISTIHSLIHSLERTKYSWRILLMDNGSDDYSVKYLLETRDGRPAARGLVYRGYVQVYYYPWTANVGVRDFAVRQVATAKYIAFADAHIQVHPDAFTNMMETLTKYKPSMVHSSMDYWGSHKAKQGAQYSIKFGEKGVYGTWSPVRITNDGPFYIGALGHAFLIMTREAYLKIGGYNPYLRRYGGGELLLCLESWLIGEGCMVDMRVHMYHSMFGRGYSFQSYELTHNYFLSTYILGGERYSISALMTYFQQKPELKPLWSQLYNEAIEEGKEQREYVKSNQKMTFEEMLGLGKEPNCDGSCRTDKLGEPHFKRPWDEKNQAEFGRHLSFVREFELREVGDKVFIGNLEITDPDALHLYDAYNKSTHL